MASTNGVLKQPIFSGRKQACFACRQRKKRCDGGPPACGFCARSGNICLYGLPTGRNNMQHKTTGSMSSGSVSVVQEFPSPISSNGTQGEQRYARKINTTTFDGLYEASNGMDFLSHENNGDAPEQLLDSITAPSVWGDLSAFAPFQDINFGMDSPIESLAPPSGPFDVLTPPNSTLKALSPSTIDDVAVPSEDHFSTLLDAFVTHCHSFLPCLHLGRLRQRAVSDFEGFQSSPLFWIIAASGSWHHKDNKKSPHGEAWLLRACLLIDQNVNSVKIPMETLQALVYLVYQAYLSASMVEMWIQLGKACRMIILLGWDRIDGKLNPSPYAPKCSGQEEQEERRRVVWAIFLLDRAMSYMAGWPLGVDDRHFMVNYPIPESQFQRSDYSVPSEPYSMNLAKLIHPNHTNEERRADSMGHIFRAYALLGRILTYYNNLHEKDYPALIDAEFSELENTLTKFHLLVHGGAARASCLSSQDRYKELWLNILVQTCTILLYHPTVKEANSETATRSIDSDPGFEKCIQAMRNMIDRIKQEVIHLMDGLLNPFLLPAYFLACRFLTITWHETKSSNDRDNIDIILMVIERIADLWGPLANKYRKIIRSDLARNSNDIRLLRKGTGCFLSDDCNNNSAT